MKHHHLKTWPEYFQAIKSGQKNFELRVNDRNFQSGDHVTLEEWNPVTKEYTGRIDEYVIGFIVDSEWGLQSGWCAFGLLPIPTSPRTTHAADEFISCDICQIYEDCDCPVDECLLSSTRR